MLRRLLSLIIIMKLTLTSVVMCGYCAEADPADGIKDCPCNQKRKLLFTCDAIYFPESCQGDNWPGDVTGTCGSELTCLGQKKLGRGERPYNMKYFNTPGNCIVQTKVNASVPVLKIDRVLSYYIDRYGDNVTTPPCYSLTPGVEVVMFNQSQSLTWDYLKTQFVQGGQST